MMRNSSKITRKTTQTGKDIAMQMTTDTVEPEDTPFFSNYRYGYDLYTHKTGAEKKPPLSLYLSLFIFLFF